MSGIVGRDVPAPLAPGVLRKKEIAPPTFIYITGVARFRYMAITEEKVGRRRHGKQFFIPAGVLIGLGLGLIAGQAAAGILIGLGLGFIATGLFRLSSAAATEDSSGRCCRHGGRWIFLAAGAFFVIVGAAILLAPTSFWIYLWPYGIGVLLILVGLSFVARMAWEQPG